MEPNVWKIPTDCINESSVSVPFRFSNNLTIIKPGDTIVNYRCVEKNQKQVFESLIFNEIYILNMDGKLKLCCPIKQNGESFLICNSKFKETSSFFCQKEELFNYLNDFKICVNFYGKISKKLTELFSNSNTVEQSIKYNNARVCGDLSYIASSWRESCAGEENFVNYEKFNNSCSTQKSLLV